MDYTNWEELKEDQRNEFIATLYSLVGSENMSISRVANSLFLLLVKEKYEKNNAFNRVTTP